MNSNPNSLEAVVDLTRRTLDASPQLTRRQAATAALAFAHRKAETGLLGPGSETLDEWRRRHA